MSTPILLAAAASLIVSGPPRPDPVTAPAATFAQSYCGGGRAIWASPVQRDQDQEGLNASRATATWSCRLGGRLLVVRDRATRPGTYLCSATVQDEVSAWVDSVKVVSRAEAGDIEDCYASPEYPRERLITLELNRRGDLIRCYLWVDGGGEAIPRCETTPARRLAASRRDVGYRPPAFVTPPGFVLHVGASPLCTRLTRDLRLGGWFGDDRSLGAFAAPMAAGWIRAEVTNGDMPPLSAVLDIDNDGAPDRVLLSPVMKVHGLAMGALSWGPKGRAKDELFTAAEPQTSIASPPDSPSPDFMAFAWQPVRIEGRTYVDVRRRAAFDWDGGDEDFLASDSWGEKAITRSLIELRPDGTQTLVCGWGPRPRPELYL